VHRNIGDLMRYAAQVTFAEMTEFGLHHVLSPETRRVRGRLPDEALYALALYIYSLKPPLNPNPFDEKAKAGEQIFARAGCPGCHTPPLYTNNKVTLAQGFRPPKDKPASIDILPVSVGTDPGLALLTRKGTGYYKIPSLRGLWYRGHYLHDGSAASLEEMFDPDRLRDSHVPGGYCPPGVQNRAINGHEFGLNLNAFERDQPIAFLRTLYGTVFAD
jgi:cytochrome c peroxidase